MFEGDKGWLWGGFVEGYQICVGDSFRRRTCFLMGISKRVKF